MSTETDYNGCLNFCKSLNNCSFFTHYAELDHCLAFVDCPTFNPDCENCYSGQRECKAEDGLRCDVPGECHGNEKVYFLLFKLF